MDRHYEYLRLYRVIDSPEQDVKAELDRLGSFIKSRASQNKELSYIVITLAQKNRVDGIVAVGGEREKVERELEIILGFIDSELETITAERVGRIKSYEQLLIPLKRSFFSENPA